MPEYVPTTEMRDRIEDALMDYGRDREDAAYSSMVKPDLAGALAEILSVLAAARREGQAEALRQAVYEFAEGAWQDQWSTDAVECDVTAVQSTYRWFVAKADQIENGVNDE